MRPHVPPRLPGYAPLGEVVQVTPMPDPGVHEHTRITGVVTSYSSSRSWQRPLRRVIDGVWVGDAWVDLDTAMSPLTRLVPAWPTTHLATGGTPVAPTDLMVGDMVYVAVGARDAFVEVVGQVTQIADSSRPWVTLGEMCIAVGWPYYAVRRLEDGCPICQHTGHEDADHAARERRWVADVDEALASLMGSRP